MVKEFYKVVNVINGSNGNGNGNGKNLEIIEYDYYEVYWKYL